MRQTRDGGQGRDRLAMFDAGSPRLRAAGRFELTGGSAKQLDPGSAPRAPYESCDAQERPQDEQDRERHILNRVPAALLNWTDDKVGEEHESDVFQTYRAQDPPKIGTERVVDALDGGKRKHVGPHDADGEERHCRFYFL